MIVHILGTPKCGSFVAAHMLKHAGIPFGSNPNQKPESDPTSLIDYELQAHYQHVIQYDGDKASIARPLADYEVNELVDFLRILRADAHYGIFEPVAALIAPILTTCYDKEQLKVIYCERDQAEIKALYQGSNFDEFYTHYDTLAKDAKATYEEAGVEIYSTTFNKIMKTDPDMFAFLNITPGQHIDPNWLNTLVTDNYNNLLLI